MNNINPIEITQPEAYSQDLVLTDCLCKAFYNNSYRHAQNKSLWSLDSYSLASWYMGVVHSGKQGEAVVDNGK